MSKIIHIAPYGVFISEFISFIEENFDTRDHEFYLLVKKRDESIDNKKYITRINYYLSLRPKNIINIIKLVFDIGRADKIILHGLNESLTILLLLLFPRQLKNCYWFTWGSDIYKYQADDPGLKLRILYQIKKRVVRKIGYIVTISDGEYRNIRKWFGATGVKYDSFKYPSNLFKEQGPEGDKNVKEGEKLTVLLGNSANPTNMHDEALELVKQQPSESDIDRIYCPLSYGDREYAEKVAAKGKDFFGERFIPMWEFMPKEQYLAFLGRVDIAIFNHRRQQAMGNIITLLGFGKKVYLRQEITTWQLLSELGLKVFSMNELELTRLDPSEGKKNRRIIRQRFSKEKLRNDLRGIFHG